MARAHTRHSHRQWFVNISSNWLQPSLLIACSFAPDAFVRNRILTCSTHGQECVRSRMSNFTNHPLYYVAPSLANVPSFRVLSFLWALNWNTLPTNIWRGDSDRLGNKLLGQCPNHRWIRPLSSRAGSSLKVWNCAFFSLSLCTRVLFIVQSLCINFIVI